MKIYHMFFYSLSGVISHIILKNCFENIRCVTCGYEKLTQKIDEISLEGERLIITNLILSQNLYDTVVNLDKKMIYIDHHLNSTKLKLSQNKNIFNRGYSSCMLTYKLFEKYIPEKNKENLKKLAIYGDTYDMWRIEDKKFNIAYALNELFWSYGSSVFTNNFLNGFRDLTNNEVKIVNKKVREKKEKILKLKKKELEIKNSILFVLDNDSYDLVSDIPLTYPKYDIYFIYLINKQKLNIKYKGECVIIEVLADVFKNREDVLNIGGDVSYGLVSYKKVNDAVFIKDVNTILSKV